MNVAPGKHPAREVLQAFGLGKLDDASITQVSRHLETCVDCKRQVAELSGDSLLDKLRQANGPAGTPAPTQTMAPLDAATAASAPPTVPPELLNNAQYEILRELGAGGMGVVYLARNKLMDRLEVLKVISTTMVHKTGALDRFLREIRAAASLSHDNVVKAYTALQLGDLLVFAMEYVEGEDLSKVVKTQGPLAIANVCYYARQAALGLQHAHEKNMVHRDIKPHNLILAKVGKKHMVKILDFGLAKAASEKKLDRDLTGQGRMLGTPDYMAPEQILDAATADIRADIYSLGCTLYYLLTGAPPFDANNLFELLQAHQSTVAKSLNLVRPDVPVELAAVVAKMMAKDPRKRYQKPVEVAQALTPFFMKPGAKGPGSSPSISVGESVKAQARRPEVATKRSETIAPPASETLVPSDKAPANWWTFAQEPLVQNPLPKKAKAEAHLRLKPLHLAGIALGMVFLGLLLWVAIFRVKTKEGILVVEVNEPNADLYLDDNKFAVTWGAGGKMAEISVKPGTHTIRVIKNGFTVYDDEVMMEEGGRLRIKARLDKTPTTSKNGKVAQADEGFVQLFNGKDLTGWKTHYSQPGNWRVVRDPSGAILTCSDKTRSFLYTERGDYTDFHLRFEGRFNDGGNGGVFFRSVFGPTFPASWPKGFEAQINSSQYSGSLWSVDGAWIVSSRKSPILPNEWYRQEVIAKGNHIVLKLDGETTVNYLDDRRSFTSGHIALQQWTRGETVVEFRKIEIKEFTPSSQAESKSTESKVNPVTLSKSDSAKVTVSNQTDPKPKDAVADLIKALSDPDPKTRAKAALGLRELGASAEPAVSELIKALRDPTPEVRRNAALALGGIGSKADPAVPELIKALRDADGEVPRDAALALSAIGPKAEIAVTALVEVVADNQEKSETRIEAAVALSRIGPVPAAIQGVATLLTVLQDTSQDSKVRERVMWCIRVHGVNLRTMPGIYPALTKLLSEPRTDGNKMLRYDCAYMLGLLQGPKAPPNVLDVLLEYLKDAKILIFENKKVIGANVVETGKGDGRVMAIQSLTEIGKTRLEQRRDIIQQVQRLANDEATNVDLREGAKKLLTSMNLGTSEFVSLFNGKDGTGWKFHPAQPGNWRVQSGVLIGSGPAYSDLFTVRDDFTDFHLRVEARINDGGNSGVFFRRSFGPATSRPNGYEAQINSTHKDPSKTGSLFVGGGAAVVNIPQSPVPPGQWFTLDVIVTGNHIVIKVNGLTTADYVDQNRLFVSGHIALQQQNPQTVVEFRKIEIKELP